MQERGSLRGEQQTRCRPSLDVHAEVDESALPLLGNLDCDSADETEQGCGVRNEPCDTGAKPDYKIQAFERVVRARSPNVHRGESKDGQPVGNVVFEVRCPVGSDLAAQPDRLRKQAFCLEAVS